MGISKYFNDLIRGQSVYVSKDLEKGFGPDVPSAAPKNMDIVILGRDDIPDTDRARALIESYDENDKARLPKLVSDMLEKAGYDKTRNLDWRLTDQINVVTHLLNDSPAALRLQGDQKQVCIITAPALDMPVGEQMAMLAHIPATYFAAHPLSAQEARSFILGHELGHCESNADYSHDRKSLREEKHADERGQAYLEKNHLPDPQRQKAIGTYLNDIRAIGIIHEPNTLAFNAGSENQSHATTFHADARSQGDSALNASVYQHEAVKLNAYAQVITGLVETNLTKETFATKEKMFEAAADLGARIAREDPEAIYYAVKYLDQKGVLDQSPEMRQIADSYFAAVDRQAPVLNSKEAHEKLDPLFGAAEKGIDKGLKEVDEMLKKHETYQPDASSAVAVSKSKPAQASFSP